VYYIISHAFCVCSDRLALLLGAPRRSAYPAAVIPATNLGIDPHIDPNAPYSGTRRP
jgi:hypothetical protein